MFCIYDFYKTIKIRLKRPSPGMSRLCRGERGPRSLVLSAESRLRASWVQPRPGSAGAPAGEGCGVWASGCAPPSHPQRAPPRSMPLPGGDPTPYTVHTARSELQSRQRKRLGRVSTNRNNDPPPKKTFSLYHIRSISRDPGRRGHGEQASMR